MSTNFNGEEAYGEATTVQNKKIGERDVIKKNIKAKRLMKHNFLQ